MAQRRFLAARLDHWAREHPRRLDLVLTGVIWLVFGSASAVVSGSTGVILATLIILPLAWRRPRPTGVLLWSIGMFAVQLVVLRVPLPADIASAIVIYTVAAHVASLRYRLFTLAAALAGSLAGGLRWSTPPSYLQNALGTAAFLAVLATLIWVIGNLVRGREANVRALHEATVRLEENRFQRERFAVQQKRVAAAREIHDIVAHSLTVVIVQADGAQYAAEHSPSWARSDARTVLTTIGRTARSALSEVRGVIDMLHDADVPRQVDVIDLFRLIDTVRVAGLPVTVEADPVVFDQVPGGTRFAALRIVRESLTNVLKHAGEQATARVLVERRPDALRIRIEDDGAGDLLGNAAAGRERTSGHGIDGMRERVLALDGIFSADTRSGVGFVVDATIPVAVEPASALTARLARSPIGADGEGER